MRNGTVDLLRIGLALMVVSIHVNPFAALGPNVLAVLGDGIFRIAVPGFFVLNGFFLWTALEEGRVGRFLRRILGLYLLWMILYLPMSYANFAGLPLAGDLRLATFGFWHLWYLPALAVAAALVYPLRRLPPMFLGSLAAAVFLIGAIIPLGQALELWQVKDWVHRNGLFLGFPFLVAGLLIRRLDIPSRASRSVWTVAAALALVLVAAESLLLRAAPHWSAHDNLFTLALAAPIVVVAVLAAPRLALPHHLGTYANGVYFCHVGTLTLVLMLPDLPLTVTWALTVALAVAVTALTLRFGLARRLF